MIETKELKDLFKYLEQLLNEFRAEVEMLKNLGFRKYVDERRLLDISVFPPTIQIRISIPNKYIKEENDEYIILSQKEIPLKVEYMDIDDTIELSFDVFTERWNYIRLLELSIGNSLIWYDYILGKVKQIRAQKLSSIFQSSNPIQLPFNIIYEGMDEDGLYLKLVFDEYKILRSYFDKYTDSYNYIAVEVDINNLINKILNRKEKDIHKLNRLRMYYTPMIILVVQDEEEIEKYVNAVKTFISTYLSTSFDKYHYDMEIGSSSIDIHIEALEMILLRLDIDFIITNDKQFMLVRKN
jgi:PII-like signaling protein